VFFPERSNDFMLGAVDVQQFDVVARRLKEECKVEFLRADHRLLCALNAATRRSLRKTPARRWKTWHWTAAVT